MIIDIINFLLIVIAIIAEYYFIYVFFIKSKRGKYPPFVPTTKKVVNEIVKIISEYLENNSQMNIAELGCGDARIICKLANKFANHNFVGYEWDKFPYFLAKIRCKKRKNVNVYRQDFMKADYTKTNFAILFTGNEIAKELSQKLASEMPKGSIIVSECFELPKMKCINEVNTDKKNYFFLPAKIFIYTIE